MSRIPLIQLPAPRAERPNDPLEEKTFKEEVLFNSSFVKMVRDDIKLPDGGLSKRLYLTHGGACAILLPVGLEYNKTVAGERYRAVGKAMGVVGIDEMNDAEAADATIAAVKQLSADVGIPANLHGILKEEDIQFLAESAYADACRPGNPRDTSVEEIVELYKSQL